ncbi:MAG TPA: TonB-dependent receptor [Thermoanaerobaculia bacterium]|nr:TonB-dependent receptor [Thermoanaerobaculia bacterium]
MVFRSRVSTAVPIGLSLCVALSLAAGAQEPPGDQPAGTVTSQVEVTTSHVPEAVESVPAEVTVITAEEIEARGVTDLAGALSLLAGVTVAPGGEAGPNGFVPELWGLREIDAFLLVVDGVPWGGAFNPAVTAISLENVERIEVLRGAAPVAYGATAFSGVIQVIHRGAGDGVRYGRVWGGSHSSGGATATLVWPSSAAGVRQSLTVEGSTQGFADDRAGVDLGHALYRAGGDLWGGNWRFDVDALTQDQVPTSPHARGNAVTVLDPRIPLDANHNPSDAKLDQDRFALTGGFDRAAMGGDWTTTLSVTHTKRDTTRGFIRRDDISDEPDVEADGFRQDAEFTDLYFDTHLTWGADSNLQLILGLDELYGKGEQNSDNFEYEIDLDGGDPPNSHSLHIDESTDLEDKRDFLGIYGQADWKPDPRFDLIAGLRLNHTKEELEGGVEAHGEEGEEEEEEGGKGDESNDKLSGVLGASWLLFGDANDGIWLFGDYRRSFKPAAIDFGPEAEADILEPETSNSVELGLKGTIADRLFWQATAFDMRLENLVMPQDLGLINGGKQRFKGYELELRWKLLDDLVWQGAAGWHDPKFEDFVQFFDPGEPTQLKGNRPELAPKRLWSSGLTWAPKEGFNAHATVEWVGDRFLNRRNTVLAPSYTEWGAGIGYRFPRWEVRLDGDNLGDERAAVSESELGDAQFYRLPARTLRLTASARF